MKDAVLLFLFALFAHIMHKQKSPRHAVVSLISTIHAVHLHQTHPITLLEDDNRLGMENVRFDVALTDQRCDDALDIFQCQLCVLPGEPRHREQFLER